jgi:hypothetical protein
MLKLMEMLFWRLEDIWDKTYYEVLNFESINNRLPNIYSKNENEKKLGKWCSHQKENKKRQRLSQDRIEKLQKIKSFNWEVDFDLKWENTKKNVEKFVINNGRYPVSTSKDKLEISYCNWVTKQKQLYKDEKLSSNRVESLQKIKGWEWEKDKLSIWENLYKELEEFVLKNNSLPYSKSDDKQERTLANWCNSQRILKRKNGLTPYQTKEFEKINNWFWDKDLNEIWDKKYEELKDFVKENNRFPSEKSLNSEEKRMSQWYYNQKKEKKNGSLCKERKNKLEKIEGWKWDSLMDSWEESFKYLVSFLENTGKFPSSESKDLIEKQNGRWCLCQRQKYKNGTLSEYAIKKFDNIPDWSWNPQDEKWFDILDHVKIFCKKNGKFPSSESQNAEEKSLGNWILKQRQLKKEMNIPLEKEKELEKIEGWTWIGRFRKTK